MKSRQCWAEPTDPDLRQRAASAATLGRGVRSCAQLPVFTDLDPFLATPRAPAPSGRARPSPLCVDPTPPRRSGFIDASKARSEPPPAGRRRAREDERLRLISEKLMSVYPARWAATSLQAKPSKNASICLVLFVRMETFQWVTTIKNKNSLSFLLAAGAPQDAGSIRRVDKGIARILIFAKSLRGLPVRPRFRRFRARVAQGWAKRLKAP
jgi:hypothetical protein